MESTLINVRQKTEKHLPSRLWRHTYAWLLILIKKNRQLFNLKMAPENSSLSQSFKFETTIRFSIIVIFFLVIAILLGRHIFNLQITQHDMYSAAAQERCLKTNSTNGLRGCIYDRDNNLLAGNIVTENVLAEPKHIAPQSRAAVFACLSQTLGLPPSDTARRFYDITETNFNITFATDVDQATADAVQNLNLANVQASPQSNSDETSQGKYYSVTMSIANKQELKEQQANIDKLGEILGKTPQEMQKIILGNNGINKPKQIVLKRQVDYQTALKLKEQMRSLKVNGIFIKKSNHRVYPQGRNLANVVGILSNDGKGISGIEQLFDKQLHPKPGKTTFLKDAKGHRLPLEEAVRVIPPSNGSDIHLTIQQEIQCIVEEELAKVVAARTPKRAYAIMMNPKTGAIMALAQYPSFDPNDRSNLNNEDPSATQMHCLVECFEPGSIMKGVVLSYGISQGAIDLDSMFYCEHGAWFFNGKTLHDTHQYDDLSILEIIKKSSNIGTAKAALEMGSERVYSGLKAFGFGQRTNLGFHPQDGKPVIFAPETPGIFRPLERWDSLSISRFPIGQGISCSPLQMMQAYAAIANKGVMMQPYIIDRIIDSRGVVTRSEPRIKARPISPRAATQITTALKSVTGKGGTATKAAVKGYSVAGKTGTSEIWVKDHYSQSDVVASFVGFTPAEDPAFVLMVSVNTPRPKGHGGTVSGPVFSAIATRTLKHLMIQPTEQPEDSIIQATNNH